MREREKMRYKIIEAWKDSNNNYISFKVQNERGIIADVRAEELGYSIKQGAKLVNATYNVETKKDRLKKEVNRNQIKSESYEVAFVIEGYVTKEDSDIGNIECNGFIFQDNVYILKDGRLYYTVKATNPTEAYYKGLSLYQDDNFGDLIETRWDLEHISKGDKYFYKGDFKI